MIEYEWCPHDMVVNFMCTTCFEDLSEYVVLLLGLYGTISLLAILSAYNFIHLFSNPLLLARERAHRAGRA